MNTGFMGLGKLGLPVALAIEKCGHNVIGYDPSENVRNILESRQLLYREIWADELLKTTRITIESIKDVVFHSEIIFVPIQTPHDPLYEGTTRIPKEKKDFEYRYLIEGITQLNDEIARQRKDVIVIIISTVLPGTIRRLIKPIVAANRHFKLCYNPFFIAMGTAMRDFLNPEFVLFGVDDPSAGVAAEHFYRTVHKAPFFRTTLENAEVIKVLYNTFISTKIAFANTAMELCHKLPNTDVDDVMNALGLADQRIISKAYLRGGMGDGGGCHPRDNIALSWLSRKLELSHDWFENVMAQREKQTEWLADLVIEQSRSYLDGHPAESVCKVYILGKAFKAGTNITTGSPSLLLSTILKEKGVECICYDPHIDDTAPVFESGVYFVGTMHEEFLSFRFPDGSIVVDPWRFIPRSSPSDKTTVIPVGYTIQ